MTDPMQDFVEDLRRRNAEIGLQVGLNDAGS